MTYPLDATRAAPISATIHDCLVAAWIADATAPVWTIDVGGHQHPGPSVDMAKHDSPSGVKDMLKAWAKEHPDLFA